MNLNEYTAIDEALINENADFIKAVVGAKTVEEAQSICKEYNVELPEDTWNEVSKSFSGQDSDSGDLSEDELAVINGGAGRGEHALKAIAGVVGLGAVIAAGSVGGVLVACAWIGYHGYKTFR